MSIATEEYSRVLKNVIIVILNKVKDIDLVEKDRFFATLRMRNMKILYFFNIFLFPSRRSK
jgi:hypothetical protein